MNYPVPYTQVNQTYPTFNSSFSIYEEVAIKNQILKNHLYPII